MAEEFIKDPDAVLDYQFNWASWLPSGDTIASVTVTADTGLVVDSSTSTSDTVTAWLSGGTAGVNYRVTCRIVTSGGRLDDRTATIKVRQR